MVRADVMVDIDGGKKSKRSFLPTEFELKLQEMMLNNASESDGTSSSGSGSENSTPKNKSKKPLSKANNPIYSIAFQNADSKLFFEGINRSCRFGHWRQA